MKVYEIYCEFTYSRIIPIGAEDENEALEFAREEFRESVSDDALYYGTCDFVIDSVKEE